MSDDSQSEYETVQYPTSRLAAVTRVQNEIVELLPRFETNFDRIVSLMDKYVMKVKVFDEICSEELSKVLSDQNNEDFKQWVDEKHGEMNKFVKKVNAMINKHREQKATNAGAEADDVSEASDRASNLTNRTKSSSASSARVRLLEMKAKSAAQKKYNEQIEQQEKQQIEVTHNLRKLKMQQEEEEQDNLEAALNALDGFTQTPRTYGVDKRKFENNVQSACNLNIPKAFLEAQERSYLPKHVPEIFSGRDVIKYKPFKLAFNRMIEQHCSDLGSRYYYLLQYTSDRAKDLVCSCQSDNASIAYEKAWTTLDNKYGNSYIVSQAYLSKLQNWPEIKYDDKQGLEDLSIFLTSCNNLRSDLRELNQLDNHREIKNIIDKLPFDLKKFWRSYAGKRLDEGEIVKFVHLEKFVATQSRLWNQPIFGELRAESKIKTKAPIGKKAFNLKTEKQPSNKTELFCPCCKKQNSHSLNDCFFFKKRSYDEKREFIIKNKICFGCLDSTEHMAKFCKRRLTCEKCKQNHPTILHRQSTYSETARKTNSSENDSDDEMQVVVHAARKEIENSNGQGGSKVLCPMLPVALSSAGGGTLVETYAALDGWAESCFISQDLVTKMNIRGEKRNILLTTMGGISQCISVMQIRNLEMSSIDGNNNVIIPLVYAIKNWPFNTSDTVKEADIKYYDHLRNIPLTFLKSGVGILIGANMANVIKPHEVVSGAEHEPFASRHILGWAITGPVKSLQSQNNICFKTRVQRLADIEKNFDSMYKRDFLDLEADVKGNSHLDKKWLDKVNHTISKINGHYVIGLPFKDENVQFPCNYSQALGCLFSLKRRFTSAESFYTDYRDFMSKLIDGGFLELVPKEQLKTEPGCCWYLIHHGVYHKRKNKLRVVFDCSKKNDGVSLNDNLLKGPDLANSLVGVLLRFREHKVAFMGDIESMFMQVKIPPHHVNFQRVLWYPDGDLSCSPHQYRLTSHTFGAVSSPSVANFALKQAAVECRESVSEAAFRTITDNAYVDDVMSSVKTVPEAISVLREAKEICASGGFNLRGIVSNSRDVMKSVSPELWAKNFENVNIGSDVLPSDSGLGITWHVNDDQIGVNIESKTHEQTRRGILSAMCSIYDPLGLLNPVMVGGRSIFQETCKLKLGWDDPLPQFLLDKWKNWYDQINLLKQFRLDRCLLGKLISPVIQLHIFSDGSLRAYGAIAYIRAIEGTEINCSLVMSKVRQTPVGGSSLRTVPRIELNAAKLAVQLKLLICRELTYQLDAVFYWTDSMTVIKYISSDTARFQRFVENRISFIRSNSERGEWNFVPGVLNVADVLSRGVSPECFLKCEVLKYGPEFLRKTPEHWPTQPTIETIKPDDSEIIKNTKTLFTKTPDFNPIFNTLFDCSNWYKLLFRICVFLVLKTCLKTKIWFNSVFSCENMKKAEIAIWQVVQSVFFVQQLSLIKRGKNLYKADSLAKLSPFVCEDGLLRVGGRINLSKESYATKHPIILPGNCSVVKCLIKYFHVKLGHMGQQCLVSSLRDHYWIVKINVIAKQIIRACVHCRKTNGRISTPYMASLPEDRVVAGRGAFYATGVDFFGPFVISRGRGKSTEKRYGVLFTCLSSRAVHLEVAFSLDIDSFLNTFRRFKARRGHVRKVYSDRGTNLVGGCSEMKRAIDQWNSKCIDKTLVQENIEWKFNTAKASSFGGIWEIEIKTARKILYALISEQPRLMTDDLLNTLFCEVEIIMNNRPLTPLSDDPSQLRPLTPSHLLLVAPESEVPPGLFDSADNYCQKRWRRVQHLADTFWTRWRKEYLRLLQVRQKWRKDVKPLKLGDLVLVSDLLLPRNQWCIGRVIRLLPSDDGRIRSVKLRIARRNPFSVTEVERPVAKLIHLMSELL